MKRLIGPGSIFLFFILLYVWRDSLFGLTGDATLPAAYQGIGYAIQIGCWLSGAILINRLIAVVIWDGLFPRAFHVSMPGLIRDVVAVIILVGALAGILGVVFDYSLTGIWATSGAVGLIVGFALRNIILDVFVGLAINFEHPFKLGDWIRIHKTGGEHDVIGQVQEINWRTTRVKTIDSNVVVVPNSFMGTSVLTNFNMPDNLGRFNTTFYLDFSVPTERALRVLEAGVRAASTNPGFIEDPPPEVYIDHVDGLGVSYKVYYWVLPSEMSPRKSRHIVVQEILSHLDHAGISLAYPKEDVYHKPMPNRQLTGKTLDERIELLSRVEIFEPLEHDELKHLAEQMTQQLFAHNDAVIIQNASGSSMFIVLEGLLNVQILFEDQEQPLRVGIIEPGEFFGEMSLLTGEPRTATVSAVTDVVAYEITEEHMSEVFTLRPSLVDEISRVVAERQVRNNEALKHLSEEKLQEHRETLADQLTSRIRLFFSQTFASSA